MIAQSFFITPELEEDENIVDCGTRGKLSHSGFKAKLASFYRFGVSPERGLVVLAEISSCWHFRGDVGLRGSERIQKTAFPVPKVDTG